MKASVALTAIGGILLLIGIGSLIYAFIPAVDTATATIPSGPNWYFVFDFPVLGGGHVSGSFEELAGRTVDVYVFTDAQYRTYDSGGTPSALFTTSAISGALNVGLPGSDTFHLVFDHGSGNDGFAQDIRVVLTVTGITPLYFVVGVVATVIGAPLLAVGLLKRRREERAAQATVPPPASNVVFYPPPASPPESPPFPPQQPPTGPGGGG